MLFIIAIVLAVYLLAIAWAWHNLDNIDKIRRTCIIIIGILIIYLITLILFYLSKAGINYGNMPMQAKIKNVLVTIFSGINAMLFLPQIAKIVNEYGNKNKQKEKRNKENNYINYCIFNMYVF